MRLSWSVHLLMSLCLETFNIYLRDWLTCSGGVDRLGEFCCNFSISNDLTYMVNPPTQTLDCDSQSCSFGFFSFFWHKYLFYSGFTSIGKFWSCCCLSFHWLFNKLKTWSISSHSFWLFLCWLRWSLWSFERCSWEDILEFCASSVASEFWEWFQDGIDVYIPHCKYQVKPHSSPWFLAACATAIVHRNHFFHLYQQNKSSESKVKFTQASNRCKRVLGGAKLAYATKICI